MKIAFTIFLMGISLHSAAQEFTLPADSAGNYIISEVVETPEFSAEVLFENAKKFIVQISKTTPDILYYTGGVDYTIKDKGSFSVHDFGIKKHIGGMVAFDLIIEIKEAKYRYSLTNFIFTPYERNRYGKFEPVKGKDIPLETKSSKLNKKNWTNYRKEVFTKSTDLTLQLKAAMIFKEPQKIPKYKKESNW